MKVRGLVPAFLCVLLVSGSVPGAGAWNDFAHMTSACLTYRKLTPRTKARVDALLKLNPCFGAWREAVRGRAASQQSALIFMLAATWPDLIKSSPLYFADGDADGNRPSGAEAARNIGYKDQLLHKYWHFCNLPFSQDGMRVLPPVPAPNALSQIAVCRKVLSSASADELKSYDLVWLMHLLADLHQPLHCATRVGKFTPTGDDGGNEVLVFCGHKSPGRLHGFWDSCLGSLSCAQAFKFAGSLSPADPSRVVDLSAGDWARESFELARQQVYVYPVRWGNGPFALTESYRRNAFLLASKRVALAGERLALLLNRELK
jgi:hypothetical protein